MNLKKRLKGSTLIEVITGVTILSITLGASLMIFVQVTEMSNSQVKTMAYLKVSELSVETEKEKDFTDDEYEMGTYRIVKEVKNYEKNPELIQVIFKAYNLKGKKLVTKQKIFLTHENEKN